MQLLSQIFYMQVSAHVCPIQDSKLKSYVNIIINENKTQLLKKKKQKPQQFLYKIIHHLTLVGRFKMP